jgi:hypothetical protein
MLALMGVAAWHGFVTTRTRETLMATSYASRTTSTHVVLDIGQDIGALIVYVSEVLLGREIEVSPKANAARRTHTEVLERSISGRIVYAGVFPALLEGNYRVWRDVMTDEDVSVAGGAITELDWRAITDATAFRTARPEVGIFETPAAPAGALEQLPSRYRQGYVASSASMGSAPMLYKEDGQVAWDQMWTEFCDLALAGGPRHRPTVLEPGTPEQVQAAPTAYAHAVAEIERGLRLVTALPTVKSATPGWVGLQCEDDEKARWLLCAIAIENVSVRREGAILFLPAAPNFQLDGEIKNVVTVLAKTHHYWQEHRNE